MKISLNSIRGMNRRYKCADDIAASGVDELIKKIGAQLGAVESIEPIGEKYQGIVIAKVVSCRKHDNSDHLNICAIDDGGITPDVKRDAAGLVQVVCGAPNVREGLLVAWLPPGATVPESVGKEPFVLEAREIRGEISNGMLTSLRELALGDDHDGILEITDPFGRVKPGDDFAEAFELKDDVVLELENKMFTHRPDCFGFLGVSRELAGIQGLQFTSPDWYQINADIPAIEAAELPLKVSNEIPELVPRIMMVALRDVQVGPSPTWLQIELAKIGQRSINNIVDYTNFFMLETGQPLHAYDYDKVKALESGDEVQIVVRNAKAGETIKLLNGKTVEPGEGTMMIATPNHLLGLGGTMGGADTEVDENTTSIILECANFDMYATRRISMRLGIFSEAVTRFSKGQSPLQNRAVLAKITNEIRQFTGGKVASPVIDLNQLQGKTTVHAPVEVTDTFINQRLGTNYSANDIKTALERVEFKVQFGDSSSAQLENSASQQTIVNGVVTSEHTSSVVISQQQTKLLVTAPFWRTDIEIAEDIVEEVGRLFGYDNLPIELPVRSIQPAQPNELLTFKHRIRESLAKAGANELLTYSFVHGNLLEKVGQDSTQAFKLSNALSPDLQYYRLSLTPSLLDKVHGNIKASYNVFALFEIGKGHNLLHADSDEGLPAEFEMLDVVYAANDKLGKPGAAFYEARKFLVTLANDLGVQIEFRAFEKEENYPVVKPYDHARSAQIFVKGTNDALGMIGEYKASIRKALKLPQHCAGFGLGIIQLLQAAKQTKAGYVALPRFPKVTQDATFKVPAAMAYQTLYDFVWDELAKLQPAQTLPSLGVIDIYQSEQDPDHKQITLRFSIASYEKTMTDKEVSKLLDEVAVTAKTTLNIERI